MSFRANRVAVPDRVERFAWGGPHGEVSHAAAYGEAGHRPATGAVPSQDLAALEREAFTKGYAQGERAGAEAAASRAEATLQRLAHTLDDLQSLRADLIRRTEREVVELSLAIAGKVVQREVSLDRDLLLAMARVALDRLADIATASIRLHPDDYAGVMAGRGPAGATTHGVAIVIDQSVRRGGCVVQSEFGSVDIGVETQIDELAQALFGDEMPGAASRLGLRDDAAA